MALTQVTTVDIIGGTISIQFYQGATLEDQITFSTSGNTFTFLATSGFTLNKIDCILYFQYLNSFYNQLLINFPNTLANVLTSWPISLFEISVTNLGVLKFNYMQTSLGNTVYTVNYLPLIMSAGFSSRSGITITLQEFLQTIDMITQYSKQVQLN